MDLCEVVCPTCFEAFEVVGPVIEESDFPVEHDYDCSVCCRPMLIVFERNYEGDKVSASAHGLGD